MDVLWAAERPLTVRDVRDRMPAQRTLAYTTVMTVLSRLHDKGMAAREPAGRAFGYRPSTPREVAASTSIREILEAADDPRAVLLHFAETASEAESAALRDALDRRRPQR